MRVDPSVLSAPRGVGDLLPCHQPRGRRRSGQSDALGFGRLDGVGANDARGGRASFAAGCRGAHHHLGQGVFDEAGHALWHAESAWSVLPDGWDQRAWRGGWLSGSEASLARWEERPGEMAARWREGEVNTALRHTDYGWHLQGEGVLFWPGPGVGCDKEDSRMRPTLYAPQGTGAPRHWWSGRLGEAPSEFEPMDLALCEAGIPLSVWEPDGTTEAGGMSNLNGTKTLNPWRWRAVGLCVGRTRMSS